MVPGSIDVGAIMPQSGDPARWLSDYGAAVSSKTCEMNYAHSMAAIVVASMLFGSSHVDGKAMRMAPDGSLYLWGEGLRSLQWGSVREEAGAGRSGGFFYIDKAMVSHLGGIKGALYRDMIETAAQGLKVLQWHYKSILGLLGLSLIPEGGHSPDRNDSSERLNRMQAALEAFMLHLDSEEARVAQVEQEVAASLGATVAMLDAEEAIRHERERLAEAEDRARVREERAVAEAKLRRQQGLAPRESRQGTRAASVGRARVLREEKTKEAVGTRVSRASSAPRKRPLSIQATAQISKAERGPKNAPQRPVEDPVALVRPGKRIGDRVAEIHMGTAKSNQVRIWDRIRPTKGITTSRPAMGKNEPQRAPLSNGGAPQSKEYGGTKNDSTTGKPGGRQTVVAFSDEVVEHPDCGASPATTTISKATKSVRDAANTFFSKQRAPLRSLTNTARGAR